MRLLCRTFAVSSAGYYARAGRGPSARTLANLELGQRIANLFAKHRKRYGAPRIFDALRKDGFSGSLGRVARLMRLLELRGRKLRRRTALRPLLADAGNRLDRRFTPGACKAVCADITEIKTRQGRRYLAAVLCLRTRRILGWSLGTGATSALAGLALNKALRRHDLRGWLHHSDRGSAYASEAYLGQLSAAGLESSFSRAGNCYDNAVMESFFATLKREYSDDSTRTEASRLEGMLATYIDGYYNRQRNHSSLGNNSPEQYAKMLSVA